MTFNPSGGTQAIRVPYRPPLAIGEGTVVTFPFEGVSVYAEVISCRQERRHGAWNLYLYVRPIPTGEVLSGFGEYAVDIREVEVL